MKKKILSLLLATCMLATVIASSLIAFAADAQSCYDITVEAAEKAVTVTVTLPGKAQAAGGNFTLQYNNSKLSFLKTIYNDSSIIVNSAYGENSVRASFSRATAITENTVLWKMEFTLNSGTVSAEDFAVTAFKMYNENSGTISSNETVTTPINFSCTHSALVENIVLKPTHSQDGKKETICTICGEVLATEVVPALGHSFGEWIVTIPETCTEKGIETRTCSCREKETRNIAALGHDEGKWIITLKPTCTQKGLQELHCTRCDMVLDTAEIDVIAHDFGDWVVEKEATALKEGLQYRVCNICNTREEEAIPKLPAEEETVEETTSRPSTTNDSQTKPTEPIGGASDENGKIPPTGDETIILPFAALAALSLGVIFITKKRKTVRQS